MVLKWPIGILAVLKYPSHSKPHLGFEMAIKITTANGLKTASKINTPKQFVCLTLKVIFIVIVLSCYMYTMTEKKGQDDNFYLYLSSY